MSPRRHAARRTNRARARHLLVLLLGLSLTLGVLTLGPAPAGAVPPADPAAAVYEAEAGSTLLVGNAAVYECGGCSGGKKVGGTYDNSSLTLYGVRAPEAGTYVTEIHYISGDARSARVSVNSRDDRQVDFPSTGDWSTVGTLTIDLELDAGANTVTIASGPGASPDFDAFFVSGALEPQPVGTTFEAEGASRTGDVQIAGCPTCWGGQKVVGIDSGESVTFERVTVKEAGTYDVDLHFLADAPRSAVLTVDGRAAQRISFPASGGTGAVGVRTVTIRLSAGSHAITVTGDRGSAPDLDRVVILGATAAVEPMPTDPDAADPIPRDRRAVTGRGRTVTFGAGDVTVRYDLGRGTADVRWRGQGGNRIDAFYSGVRLGDGNRFVTTQQYRGGCRYAAREVTCARSGLPTLRQQFAFDGRRGFTVRLAVSDAGRTVSTNLMVPVAVDRPSGVRLRADHDQRVLLVPYDNDAWVRYEAREAADATPAQRSFEVGAFYDSRSRDGLVIGSLDRDRWKTAVLADGGRRGGLDRLQVGAGITDWSYDYGDADNRFQFNREKRSHNPVTGTTVRSPRIFVGMYADWRDGMETFGTAVSRTVDSLTWDKGTPFGYNSWGGLGARAGDGNEPMNQVSDFIADELPEFRNTSAGSPGPYVGIDSYWDKLISPQYEFEREDADWSKLEAYVAKVRSNGQEPALYFQPFAHFWQEGIDAKIRGTALCDGCPNQTLRQMTLHVNGQPVLHNGAWALDPTNPGVINRGRIALEKFRELGVRYVKLDFLTHGYLEADGWFDPNVHSGEQAFHQGMTEVSQILGDDMFVDLAISPLFASQYAHARRISCDVHGAMNNWHESDPDQYQKSTENLLNSVTYGWWLDRVYAYNDADHVQLGNYYYDDSANAQLFDPPLPRIWPESQNRARVTSAVITGVYLISEDFTEDADPALKARAKQLLTNPEVNRIAEIGRTFRPVESDTGFKAGDLYVLRQGDVSYLAIFNFSARPRSYSYDLRELGLAGAGRSWTELWTGERSTVGQQLRTTVGGEDVKLFKITR